MRFFVKLTICSFILFGVLAPVIPDYSSGSLEFSVVQAQEVNLEDGTNECGFTNVSCWLPKVVANVIAAFVYAILQAVAFVLWASGAILDGSISHTVTNMNKNVSGNGITLAWTALRDIANLLFIFILLWQAIKTIVGLDDEKTKKILVSIVLIGLLMNFSLFITKAVVDSSNVLALHFYDQAGIAGIEDEVDIGDDKKVVGIAGRLIEPLKITSIWESSGSAEGFAENRTLTEIGKLLILGVMGSIFMLVAAFVLVAMAFLFLIRFVTLVLLMVLSPLAFAAMILPETQKHAKAWWSKLISESFYAPIQLALLYVVVLILGGGSDKKSIAGDNSGGFGGFFDGSSSQLVINFLIITFLLIASLIVAKKMGAGGASGALSIGKKMEKGARNRIQRGAGRATAGTVGYAGRQSLGRIGQKFSESEWLKKNVAKGGIVGGVASGARALSNKAAQGSYDVRSTGLTGKAIGSAGGKGGFRKSEEDYQKRKEETAKDLAPSQIEIGRADQELEQIKKTDPEQYNQKVSEKISANREKRAQATDTFQRQALDKEYEGLRKDTYENKRAETQQTADRLKGVDEKELRTRVQKIKNLTKSQQEELKKAKSKEDLEAFVNKVVPDEQEREIKGLVMHKGEAKERAEKYAKTTEDANVLIRMATGRSKRSRKRAAATVRKNVVKGKKPVKDQLETILQESGEIETANEASSEPEATSDQEESNTQTT